jgi:hypothetical protein
MPLQQFIEWEAEDIEPKVDAKKRVGNSERAAIAKTEKSVPLAGNAQCKDQRKNYNGKIYSKDQQTRANVDIDCPACVSGVPEGLAEEAFSVHQVDVPRRQAKIKP